METIRSKISRYGNIRYCKENFFPLTQMQMRLCWSIPMPKITISSWERWL